MTLLKKFYVCCWNLLTSVLNLIFSVSLQRASVSLPLLVILIFSLASYISLRTDVFYLFTSYYKCTRSVDESHTSSCLGV